MTVDNKAGLRIRRVSGALGAEVHGARLGRLTDEEFTEIQELLLRHLVLFFPGQQELAPEEHVAFGARFGTVEEHPFLQKLPGHDKIVVIDSANGVDKVDYWHTDVTFDANPPIASILHLVTCPEVGGDTMWSNQYAVYEGLSEPMRHLLDGLTAVHSVQSPQGRRSAEHPVVRRHPATRRRSLYVNRLFTSYIPELSPGESEAVLRYLFEFSEQPQFTCRYHWSAGTVAMWDNRATQHYAVNDYTERRIGQRVTVLGDVPTGDVPRWEKFQLGDGASAAMSRIDR